MVLSDVVRKLSIIKFEDKYLKTNSYSGDYDLDGEAIRCKIPELNLGERIVLNAWGSWKVRFYKNDYRKRLGIYLVTSKGDEGKHKSSRQICYTLKEEEEFSEPKLVDIFLSGNSTQTIKEVKGLKYIALNPYGKPLSLQI